MANPNLTAERLRERLHYNPDTGIFTWSKKARGRFMGSQAGALLSTGYLQIDILGSKHSAHRLAWLYSYSEWPSQCIDHIDGDRKNNCLSNLRDVSQTHNNQNIRRTQKTKTSCNLLGVRPRKSKNKKTPDLIRWEADIEVNSKSIHLGTFATEMEAHAAYLSAKRMYHPGFLL